MNMLLIEPEDLIGQNHANVTGWRARHLLEELRVKPGTSLSIGLLNGPTGEGTVLSVATEQVEIKCQWNKSPPSIPIVDVILAMPRPKVMKRLWAQLAALGVRRIAIVNAEHVERFYFDSHVLLPAFYRPLLIEGLQQSATTYLPDIRVEKRLKVFIEDILEQWAGTGWRLAADPKAAHGVSQMVLDRSFARVALAVGPETGWSDYERELLANNGFRFFTLGRRILRADTACIVSLALIKNLISPEHPFD